MRDQFIAGLGCFWKCGPMWFTISLDPPPSTWRRKYRLSDKWPQTWPASSWHAISEQCMVVESSAQGKELLPSLVHISAWVQPLNGLHALFWDLSVSNASVSTSSKFWTDMQFWFFPSLTKPNTVSHPVSAWNIRRACDIVLKLTASECMSCHYDIHILTCFPYVTTSSSLNDCMSGEEFLLVWALYM